MFIDLLRKITGSGSPPREDELRETLSRDLEVAASVVLLETACSDTDITRRERELITRILTDKFRIKGDQARELIETGESILREDTNKWRFMNIINRSFSPGEKREFMENIWRIILSDGRIHKYEDHIARRTAKVLKIPHKEMIEAKMKVMREENVSSST